MAPFFHNRKLLAGHKTAARVITSAAVANTYLSLAPFTGLGLSPERAMSV
jgi:hypothetical protein